MHGVHTTFSISMLSSGLAQGRKSRSLSHRGLLSGLEASWNCHTQLQTSFRLVTPLFLLFSSFQNEKVYPMVCPSLYFRMTYAFSDFTGLWMSRNFALGWTIPRTSSILDLDNEVWDFLELTFKFGIYGWCWNGLRILEVLEWCECIFHI